MATTRASSKKRRTLSARCRIVRLKNGKLVCQWYYGGRKIKYSTLLAMKKYDAAKLAQIKAAAKKRRRAAKKAAGKRKASRSPAKKSKRGASKKAKKSKRSASKSKKAKKTKRSKSQEARRRKVRRSGYGRFIRAVHYCASRKGLVCPSAAKMAHKWRNLPEKYKQLFRDAKSDKHACQLYGYIQRKNKALKVVCKSKPKATKRKASPKRKVTKRKASPKRKSPKKAKSPKRKSPKKASKSKSPKRKPAKKGAKKAMRK